MNLSHSYAKLKTWHFSDLAIIKSWICPECGADHIRNVNAAINLKENAIKTVGQGMSEFRPVEGVEDLAMLALQIGASEETENLAGDGLNVLTL